MHGGWRLYPILLLVTSAWGPQCRSGTGSLSLESWPECLAVHPHQDSSWAHPIKQNPLGKTVILSNQPGHSLARSPYFFQSAYRGERDREHKLFIP